MTDSLKCEQVPYSALAAEYGTPLYVYSQQAMAAALNQYQQAFASLQPLICYAVKANSNLSILRYFAQLGCGFDIVSGGELQRVLLAGGDAGKTIFSGVGKSKAEIEFALNNNIRCFNVESLAELERINTIAAGLDKIAPISLRINPDVNAHTHPYISTGLKANKFGIAYQDALAAYQLATTLPHLKITGIDCHIGSQLTDLSPLIEALERMLLLVDKLAEQNIELEHIDLGGGVGIVYQNENVPDLAAYATAVSRLLSGRKLQLMLEPGRSLIGNAGGLLTTVEYIKQGEEKNFVIVDAAMNDLMRPSLYQAYHNILNTCPTTADEFVADVVGPICETGDFLAKDRTISAQAGDLLLIQSAGAYASSMASNYNTRCRGAEVLVNGTEHHLIRQRETVPDLLASEIACL
ncbi:diaminopimelate decarboxylase [Snodgrassella alvi]|uniref:diaminopimelate decarboxylase n=1 Tax=Snodgrassella alvi TaxID=1196083 RepID=UPI000C1F21A3|nr:diaminopimelate decarboxylase [Snodgrassella alvi]PIT15292.1 diaminopimelate decarboxylase [Snodgrassella alvi]PIT16365.1 diaminopimelate decarboxylase [Snodgrassella alvi]